VDVGVFEAFRYVKNAPAESKFSAPQSIADLVRTAAVRNPAKAVPAHAASSIPNSNNKSRSHEKGKSKPQKSRVDNVRRSSRDAGAKVNYKLQESGDSDSDVQVVEPRGRAAAVKSRRSQPSGTASFDEESEDEEGEESDEVSEPEMESESDVKPVTKKSARARKGASDDDDDDSSNDDDQSDESDDQGDVEEVEPLESIEKLIGHQIVDGVDQFLIKFKNMSYMHNRWMTADDLISQFEGSRLRISRFLTKEAAGELDADYYTSGELCVFFDDSIFRLLSFHDSLCFSSVSIPNISKLTESLRTMSVKSLRMRNLIPICRFRLRPPLHSNTLIQRCMRACSSWSSGNRCRTRMLPGSVTHLFAPSLRRLFSTSRDKSCLGRRVPLICGVASCRRTLRSRLRIETRMHFVRISSRD
jgi:hypothetical protein